MNVIGTALPDVLLIRPRIFRDARGYFIETWSQARYADAGVPAPFVQDNVSSSAGGVLRGLHFQWPHPQGKLVQVLRGAVRDVVVDVRVGSPAFGRWAAFELTAEGGEQLWVPPGFAHGFVVRSEHALFAYKCTAPYRPEYEATLRWDDPAVGVDWDVAEPLVSAKDRAGLLLADFAEERLPRSAALAGAGV